MKTISIWIAGTALALSACATTGNITTDFDQSQNFTEYKTFAWAGESPMVVFGDRLVPAIISAQVERAIREDLTAKGYRFTENVADADFAVSFTIGTRDGTDIRQTPDFFWAERARWNWGNAYFPRIPTMPPMRTEVREYTEGTLSVDVYDVERRTPVWHGVGERNLTRSELRGETNTAAEDTKAILAGFPPN